MRVHILLLDDDENLLAGLARTLRKDGWNVDTANTAASALEVIDQYDLLVSDMRMPTMDGLQVLREARKKHPRIQVIIMTAFGNVPSAVEAMREGARAYLTKPFDEEELKAHLREVKEVVDLRRAVSQSGSGGLVGSSAVMRNVYSEIDVAAASLSPVLITGASGTGKGIAASEIHTSSARRNNPFITINLGALPRDLVEGELFGHEKGAFTGAHSKRTGRFMLAASGTLFLDEIDSLPIELQPKLLQAVEQKEIWPLGAEAAQDVDVRIIAATNAPVEELVRQGKFREDLYYRINVLRLTMPTLREHPEDIPQIARVLLDRMAEDYPGLTVELTPAALAYLVGQEWPGNVRELSNILERAFARSMAKVSTEEESCRHLTIDARAFSVDAAPPAPPPSGDLSFAEAKEKAVALWASNAIESALAATNGNVSEAARQLKMNRTALIRLMKKLNLSA